MKYEIPKIKKSDTIKNYDVIERVSYKKTAVSKEEAKKLKYIRVKYLDGSTDSVAVSQENKIRIQGIQESQAKKYVNNKELIKTGLKKQKEVILATTITSSVVMATGYILIKTPLLDGNARAIVSSNYFNNSLITITIIGGAVVIYGIIEFIRAIKKSKNLDTYVYYFENRETIDEKYPAILNIEANLTGDKEIKNYERLTLNNIDSYDADDLERMVCKVKRYENIAPIK